MRFALLALLAVITGLLVQQGNTLPVLQDETAFSRVMRAGVIRCGYYKQAPAMYRDAETGALTGFTVDMMDTIAAKAGLTVEWTQEVPFATWQNDLAANHFDAMCTPSWLYAPLSRQVQFGRPMFYVLMQAIGRADDKRFKTLADLNKPEVTISVHEGSKIHNLIGDVFPKATVITVPATANEMLPIIAVTDGRADMVVTDRNVLARWNPQNPDKRIAVLVEAPVKVQAYSLVAAAGEGDLIAFLDNAVNDMLATNALPRLMDKWMPQKGIYLPPAVVYQQ